MKYYEFLRVFTRALTFSARNLHLSRPPSCSFSRARVPEIAVQQKATDEILVWNGHLCIMIFFWYSAALTRIMCGNDLIWISNTFLWGFRSALLFLAGNSYWKWSRHRVEFSNDHFLLLFNVFFMNWLNWLIHFNIPIKSSVIQQFVPITHFLLIGKARSNGTSDVRQQLKIYKNTIIRKTCRRIWFITT